MKMRVRSKNSKSNPVKMIGAKKRVFKLKCYMVLSVIGNIAAGCYIYFNNL